MPPRSFRHPSGPHPGNLPAIDMSEVSGNILPIFSISRRAVGNPVSDRLRSLSDARLFKAASILWALGPTLKT